MVSPGFKSLLKNSQTGSGAHSVSYLMGAMGPRPGIRQPGCEVNHSTPSSAEVKNGRSNTSLPICLHGMERDTFTFTFYRLFSIVPRSHGTIHFTVFTVCL